MSNGIKPTLQERRIANSYLLRQIDEAKELQKYHETKAIEYQTKVAALYVTAIHQWSALSADMDAEIRRLQRMTEDMSHGMSPVILLKDEEEAEKKLTDSDFTRWKI